MGLGRKRWLTLFVGVVDVEQCEVVSINVSKPHLGLIRLLLGLCRPQEDLGHWGKVLMSGSDVLLGQWFIDHCTTDLTAWL